MAHAVGYGPICRDFGPSDLEPLLAATGITHTITVQAANSSRTPTRCSPAPSHAWIAGVKGWVPLLEPREAERALGATPGIRPSTASRHLVDDEPDPDRLLRPPVLESLALLAERGGVFDIPAVFPRHLVHVPRLAGDLPDLKIVIDHLAKPPIDRGELAAGPPTWSCRVVSQCVREVSGVNTGRPQRWSAEDLRPFVEVALGEFGASG